MSFHQSELMATFFKEVSPPKMAVYYLASEDYHIEEVLHLLSETCPQNLATKDGGVHDDGAVLNPTMALTFFEVMNANAELMELIPRLIESVDDFMALARSGYSCIIYQT